MILPPEQIDMDSIRYVVSVDPGTAAMGMALWEIIDGKSVLRDGKTFRNNRVTAGKRRAYYKAADAVVGFVEWLESLDVSPDLLVIEAYHVRQAKAQQDGVLLVIGALMERARTQGIPIVLVESPAWMAWYRRWRGRLDSWMVGQMPRTSEHLRDAVYLGAWVLAHHEALPRELAELNIRFKSFLGTPLYQ